MEARRRRAVSASIYKEELKTVVRELLARTQPNRHETPTVLWNPYHRVSLRGRRARIRFSRGAPGKKQKTTVRHFGFTEKVYGLSCTVRTMLLWKCHHRNAASCVFRIFTGRHSGGLAEDVLPLLVSESAVALSM